MSRQAKKKSTVRHTRAIQRDRETRPNTAPPEAQIQQYLSELIHPATYAQLDSYRAMGLRERILTLPVMVAFVLSLIWRQLSSVSEAVRVLRREGLLWSAPLDVTQQAVSERLRTLKASLFEAVLSEVLPEMHRRAAARSRPLNPAVARARAHFDSVVALDGSTLDALVRKAGLLRTSEQTPLAGRMAALLDVGTLLPQQIWFTPNAQANDRRFWPEVCEALEASVAEGLKPLVLFDLGLVKHTLLDDLTELGVGLITRLRKGSSYHVTRVLASTDQVRDSLIVLGSTGARCQRQMRLVEVLFQGQWYQYLTNVLDPVVLSARDVASLYRSRWRIEDAFRIVKRLLGLAYFYSGCQNVVELQLWMTWLLYSVVVDLSDAVAEALDKPLQRISFEMVFRGLYHFTQAYHRGEAQDPVRYLAEAKDLGIVKRKRRRSKDPPDKNLTTANSP